jgi:hypothetical protein
MWYANYNEFPITPGMDLYVGDKKGLNTVCKCIGKAFFFCQGVGYTNDLFRSVTNADNDGTTRSICKGNGSLNNVLEGFTIFLKFERLAFIPGQIRLNHPPLLI